MSIQIDIAGEQLLLLPERAAFWARERMLIIADIHFGKAAAFRAQGMPVPRGTTTENLDTLTALVKKLGVGHILFLGDFLHGKASHAPATLDAMRGWRAQHPQLRLTLVRGNHDARAGDPPADLSIEIVDEPHVIGAFAFCHHPDLRTDAYVLAGHVHPVYHLAAGADRLRLPCFLFGPQRAILPSFGAFTGGYAVQPEAGERLFLAAGDAVLEVPAAAAVSSRLR